jgi:RNA polymerase-binding transcription factor DksA
MDAGDQAAARAADDLIVALRAHAARAESSEGQSLGADGVVYCTWCAEPIDAARLAAQPRALRHADCQRDYEQHVRRHP